MVLERERERAAATVTVEAEAERNRTHFLELLEREEAGESDGRGDGNGIGMGSGSGSGSTMIAQTTSGPHQRLPIVQLQQGRMITASDVPSQLDEAGQQLNAQHLKTVLRWRETEHLNCVL